MAMDFLKWSGAGMRSLPEEYQITICRAIEKDLTTEVEWAEENKETELMWPQLIITGAKKCNEFELWETDKRAKTTKFWDDSSGWNGIWSWSKNILVTVREVMQNAEAFLGLLLGEYTLIDDW